MSYWFVSHASLDKPRVKPVAEALINQNVPLWIDRPYDINIATNHVSGYIREGEEWTLEILKGLVNSCGVLTFTSEASSKSDECRLELGLARVFSLATDFPIVPVVFETSDWTYLDHRVAQTQGRHFPLVETSNVYSLNSADDKRFFEFAKLLNDRANTQSQNPDVLDNLRNNYVKTIEGYGQKESPPRTDHQIVGEFGKLVDQYRQANGPDQRRAIDARVLGAIRQYPLEEVWRHLQHNDFEDAVAIAAASAISSFNPDDNLKTVTQVVIALLRLKSAGVRFRVGNAIISRAQSRGFNSFQNYELSSILEGAITKEPNNDVAQILRSARDWVSGS